MPALCAKAVWAIVHIFRGRGRLVALNEPAGRSLVPHAGFDSTSSRGTCRPLAFSFPPSLDHRAYLSTHVPRRNEDENKSNTLGSVASLLAAVTTWASFLPPPVAWDIMMGCTKISAQIANITIRPGSFVATIYFYYLGQRRRSVMAPTLESHELGRNL